MAVTLSHISHPHKEKEETKTAWWPLSTYYDVVVIVIYLPREYVRHIHVLFFRIQCTFLFLPLLFFHILLFHILLFLFLRRKRKRAHTCASTRVSACVHTSHTFHSNSLATLLSYSEKNTTFSKKWKLKWPKPAVIFSDTRQKPSYYIIYNNMSKLSLWGGCTHLKINASCIRSGSVSAVCAYSRSVLISWLLYSITTLAIISSQVFSSWQISFKMSISNTDTELKVRSSLEETDESGDYKRQDSTFREIISPAPWIQTGSWEISFVYFSCLVSFNPLNSPCRCYD